MSETNKNSVDILDVRVVVRKFPGKEEWGVFSKTRTNERGTSRCYKRGLTKEDAVKLKNNIEMFGEEYIKVNRKRIKSISDSVILGIQNNFEKMVKDNVGVNVFFSNYANKKWVIVGNNKRDVEKAVKFVIKKGIMKFESDSSFITNFKDDPNHYYAYMEIIQ